MTIPRLLAAALIVCSVPALAQDQQTQSQWSSTGVITVQFRKGPTLNREVFFFDLNLPTAATAAEPWRIIPNRPRDLDLGQTPDQLSLGPPEIDRVRYFTGKSYSVSNVHSCSEWREADSTCHLVRFFFMYMLPNGQPAQVDAPVNESDVVGPTCYAIRSYVVARDSKDSDSTHQAGYSTCQPSNRYQVKSADLRVVSGDR